MKLEVLHSLSMTVMIVGLILSALGGFGAYFFSGGTERPGRAPTSSHVESTEPELPVRDTQVATTKPGAETATGLPLIPDPVPASAEPPPAISKVAITETKTRPAFPTASRIPPAPAPPEPAKPAGTEPASAISTVANSEPKAPADLPPVVEKLPATVRITPPPEPRKFAMTVPAPTIPKIAIPKASAPADLPPVAPAPEPPKPAKAEPAATVSNGANPEAKTPASQTDGLGIVAEKRDKMIERLRTFPHGSIAIEVPVDNQEALDFANALKDAFHTAGWKVTSVTAVKPKRDTNGLTLSSGTFPPPADVTTVFSALVSAGMKLSTDLDPKQGKKSATLFVGSRP